jgi:hypothetical protein
MGGAAAPDGQTASEFWRASDKSSARVRRRVIVRAFLLVKRVVRDRIELLTFRFSGVLSFLKPYYHGGQSAQLTRIDAGHWAYTPILAIVPPCAGNAVLFVLPAC